MRENRKGNEIRNDGKRIVSGYAVVFNSLSELMQKDGIVFREIIKPEAITQEVIDNSDILCLLNHNEEKVLARSNKGKGTLKLQLDEKGVSFEFELPNSPLGEEVEEGIKRGDLSFCSFSFTIAEGGDNWEIQQDGTYLRTITDIKQLFDVSIVWHPAYEETNVEVDTRGLQRLKENNELIQNNKMAKRSKTKRSAEEVLELLTEVLLDNQEEIIEENNEEVTDEEEVVVEEKNECQEETEDEENRNDEEITQEEEIEENSDEEEVEETETTEEEEKEENKRNKRNKKISTMKEKRFSLIKAINDMANGKPMDEVTRMVDAEGRSQAKKNGFNVTKGLVLPITMKNEKRSAVVAGLANQGKENIATDVLDLLEPLRSNLVLAKSGATVMTGLVGNVQIPRYSGSNVGWKNEVVSADDGAGSFDALNLTPKRLTAYLDVSMQFLQQQNNGAEEVLRRDLINAISEKLEATLLGNEAGTTDKPEGLFYNVTAESGDLTFADVIAMEEELDSANVGSNRSYILSPKAKAYFRSTSTDAGSGRFIMEAGEIEGIATETSSAVTEKGVVLGDWSDYVIGQWGGLELTVDPYTKAVDGCVRLVVNSYFDAGARRPEAFAKRILK